MKKVLILWLVASAASAHAQPVYVPKDDTLKGAGKEDVDGWNPALAGTATINLVSNSNVVGQVDGFSTLFGLGVVAGADYVKGKHLMRNTLTVVESFARTPVVDEFVKTNDVVGLEGLYNYFLTKKVGLFGRAAITTSMFAATDVRGVETTWIEKGTMTPFTTNGFRQRLADPFKPFTLAESAGLFAEPYGKEKFALSLRFGVGGRHTLAEGVLLIDDDKATPEVELLRLANVHQLGLEGFAGIGGKLEKGKFTYKAGIAVLAPFVNNDKFERSVGTLTRVGFEGTLTFNVFEWMSVVYSMKIVKDAQLFPEGDELTQIQNNVLLTFKYAFVEKKKKKEPTADDKALAEAKAKAEAAEKALQEAETKVRSLEKVLEVCKAFVCPAASPAPGAIELPN